MIDFDQLAQDIARFQGETVAGITHISKTLERIEEDRKSHTKEFWDKIDLMVNSLHAETRERIEGDGKIEGCLKVVKDRQNNADRKAGIIGGVVGGVLVGIKVLSDYLISGK